LFFLPYHNRGHHTNVGTPKDPASARRNEWLFVFWFRSQIGSYIQAWQIETQRMRITKRLWFSLRNKMVVYTLAHLGLLFFIFFNFGAVALYAFLGASIFGIILLETVNYIEHYGLPANKSQWPITSRHESAPNMPTGYPGMMLLALIPPLFFRVMNKAADKALSTGQ
jgi:alkane 1-monooxygenase